MKTFFIALLFLGLLGCGGSHPQPPVFQTTPGGTVNINQTGIVGSEILRVPFPEDGVICYVAMESRNLKGIECLIVPPKTEK